MTLILQYVKFTSVKPPHEFERVALSGFEFFRIALALAEGTTIITLRSLFLPRLRMKEMTTGLTHFDAHFWDYVLVELYAQIFAFMFPILNENLIWIQVRQHFLVRLKRIVLLYTSKL